MPDETPSSETSPAVSTATPTPSGPPAPPTYPPPPQPTVVVPPPAPPSAGPPAPAPSPAVAVDPSPGDAPSGTAIATDSPVSADTDGPAAVPDTRPAEATGPAGGKTPAWRGRRLVSTVVFATVVVLLLAAIGYLVYQRFYADPTRNATAGDCLADLPIVSVGEDQEVGAARIVECTDAAATFVVEGRLDRLTEDQANSETICQAYENATFIYRAMPRGGSGYVLCLRALDT